jgi:hypothetical protein
LEQSWRTAMRQKMEEPNKGKQLPGFKLGKEMRV